MPEAKVLPTHGARKLGPVRLDSYNVELRDQGGLVGDRASSRAFGSILENWRERMRDVSADPLGDETGGRVSKKRLDKLLLQGDAEKAGLVLSAVEEFAQELGAVCQRLLRLEAWHNTEAVVVGGGFRASRIGELAIGRAGAVLKAGGVDVTLRPIHHDPDVAGLLGNAWLLPRSALANHDAVLGVDIGGSTIRAGLVLLQWQGPELAGAEVLMAKNWRYRGSDPGRDEAVQRLIGMLNKLIRKAEKQDLRLAPLIGVGCPGLIRSDGTIERGGQNLPGDWETPDFNLPRLIRTSTRMIGKQPPDVLLHNDAVVQGLSQLPFMTHTRHWGVLTIGTGLGNAHFSRCV